MAVITSQQLNNYFNNFRDTSVTFNAEVVKALGFQAKDIFLKYSGGNIPCILYSTSFQSAKILVNLNSDLMKKLQASSGVVSLRFSFHREEKRSEILNFFVSGKISGYAAYDKSKPNLVFISITFTQRPPDDLIEILGTLIEANVNAKKRKDERILITAENAKGLSLKNKNTVIKIDNVDRRGLLRDLSFSGAKILLVGLGKFMVDKPALLRVDFEDEEPCYIPGRVLRFEEVSGRKDISAIAIKFDEEKVPIVYRMRLNYFFKHRKLIKQSTLQQEVREKAKKSDTDQESAEKAEKS